MYLKLNIIFYRLLLGHRFRTTYDFGFASLDILTVYGEDSGTYTCRAINKIGQAVSSVDISVKREYIEMYLFFLLFNFFY